MKVFTNTNFGTGKAHAKILENRIVGLDTTDGNVIQAIADTVPIGVSHNYAADAGCPITVIPLGAGFARVKSGMNFDASDLGSMVGPDANGCAVTGALHSVGILAGLSADVEGEIASVAGDDVVVLLCGCGGLNSNPNGTARFEVTDGDNLAVEGVLITIAIPDGDDLTGYTDEHGIVEFILPAGKYDWAATLDGYTISPNDGDITVVEGEETVEELTATEVTPQKGTVKFTVLDGSQAGVDGVEIEISYDSTVVDTKMTDSSGVANFEIDTGIYTWKATKEDYSFAPSDTDSVTIPVGAAADPVNLVATEVTPQKGTVKFTVVDGEDTGVKDVEIELSYNSTVADTKMTDEDGVAEFEIDTGIYTWKATKEDYSFAPSDTDSVTIPVGAAADPVNLVATYTGG